MADKKANITPLNLQGSINLNQMKSEVMDYSSGSFNRKNSLFYNNTLTNWYKNTIPNNVYKQYKGKPINVTGSYVTYGDKTFTIPGVSIKVEETEYFEPTKKLYTQDGYIYAGNQPVVAMPYAGYLSITKLTSTQWLVSVVPYSPTSILDFITYRMTVNEVGESITVGGIDEIKACLIHAETGYGVYVEHPTLAFAEVKYGFTLSAATTFEGIFPSDVNKTTIQFGKTSYSVGVHEPLQESGNYQADFTIVATKHYIQCTFDEGIAPQSYKKYFVRNTGFFADGFKRIETNATTGSRALFGSLSTYHNGYRRDIALTTDGSKAWWSGGVLVPLLDKDGVRTFDVLYNYSGVIEGISVNGSWITRDVDEILEIKTDWDKNGVLQGETLTYKFKNKYYKITKGTTSANKQYFLVKNFLCFNTDNHDNTINLDTGEIFCRSDDYNNRVFPTLHLPGNATNDSGSGDKQLYNKSDYYVVCEQTALGSDTTLHYTLESSNVALLYASGVNEMYYADNISNPSTIEAPISITGSFKEDKFKENIKKFSMMNAFCDKVYSNIDVFLPNTYGGVPLYFDSLGSKQISNSLSFGVTAYPMDTNSNTLYNLSVIDEIVDTYLNQCIINTQNYSTFTVMDNKLNPILAYYLLSMVEFSNVFIMQGTYYACSGDYIIKLTINSGVVSGTDVVANIKDLKFIGSTTNEAYFFSLFDYSIYTFTGDFNLTKQIEVTSINTVYKSYNNPAIGLIAVTTNAGLIVMYQGQICLLEDCTSEDVYYDDKCIINGKTRISLEPRENFIKEPIIIETELYGEGSEVKSINDCVYIRLYTEELVGGTIKITSRTLNEISKSSETKEIKINKGSWDSDSGTMFIRYQPKNQAATGFAVKVESDFPVASISISHKAETVQSSNHNL